MARCSICDKGGQPELFDSPGLEVLKLYSDGAQQAEVAQVSYGKSGHCTYLQDRPDLH